MKQDKGFSGQFIAGCNAIINSCAYVRSGEKVLVISNESTNSIGMFLQKEAGKITDYSKHVSIPLSSIHGQEPPPDIAQLMIDSEVIICVTKKSMAHTNACVNALENGARYLSLPDYSQPVVESPALLYDFSEADEVSKDIAEKLTKGKILRITSQAGTDLLCNIDGRIGNPAPGFCNLPGSIASPPDAEANIALVENMSNGILVVDGSIPCNEIGLLKSPQEYVIKNGKVEKISGDKSEILNNIFDHLNNPATRVVAEFGIGLNPLAKLKGFMLEDEGALGTIHIGIGANIVLGGVNSVPFHLDHIIINPNVYIDSELLLGEGVLQ